MCQSLYALQTQAFEHEANVTTSTPPPNLQPFTATLYNQPIQSQAGAFVANNRFMNVIVALDYRNDPKEHLQQVDVDMFFSMVE